MTPLLHEYDIAKGVVAFSSTRRGGVSLGHYGEFNINEYCGDDAAHTAANRMALCGLLRVQPDHLVFPHQTHGDVVIKVDGQWLDSLSPAEKRGSLEGVDAVMTNLYDVCVGVSTADCIPVLLYDEAHHACCAVHAGWRGTVGKISRKAVEAMAVSYGSKPEQLKAVIGPGISLLHFEVGDEVYEQFSRAGFDMQLISRKYEKWHIDLWEANRQLLLAAGMREELIQVSGICTYDRVEEFFSARRLGILSGRIFTAIMMRGDGREV